MRKTAFAGLFVAVIVITANGSSKASAESLGLLQLDNSEIPGVSLPQSDILARIEQIDDAPVEPAAPTEPEVQKHLVAENDTLGKIAESHNTTWKRLFDKNEAISSPDLIKPGDELIIPPPDEVLKDRPLPEPAPEPVEPAAPANRSKPAARRTRSAQTTTRQTTRVRGTSAGNRYVAGYCTWYAKNMRPDLPNNLGNANTWVARARAQGIPTGSAPRVGAIGQQGMHVVYVRAVNGDGTVTISEMNFRGRGVISSRTVPASNFQYIY